MSSKNIIDVRNIINSTTDIDSNCEKRLGGADAVSDTDFDNELDLDSTENNSQDSTLEADNLTDDTEGVETDDNESEKMVVSYVKTSIIPQGTKLYHASYTRDTFDPVKINLNRNVNKDINKYNNEDKKQPYLSAFFSTTRELASARINGCTEYPRKHGYIHTFETKNDIDKLYLVSQYDIDNWDLGEIEFEYCNSPNADANKYNGVGMHILNEGGNKTDSAEYALCNPQQFLKYINTIKCKSYGEYSKEYRFDEKNEIQD
jgi:hypothetical protein